MANVNVTINGKICAARPGTTILQAARENDIHIPTLCHFEGIEGRARNEDIPACMRHKGA